MLRVLVGMRTWACTCRNVLMVDLASKCVQRPLQTSVVNQVLDKEIRGKKKLQETMNESDPVGVAKEDEDDEGLDFKEITPTADTDSMIIAGQRFDELPVAYIKATNNNTIMSLHNHKGELIFLNSAGIEGFKNARKGTTIAAQATGLTIGQKALGEGIKHVRVKVKGIGPGRLPAIKGLQMAGMTVVSITDNTKIEFYTRRPRKQRRV